jgi:hypothetical protein
MAFSVLICDGILDDEKKPYSGVRPVTRRIYDIKDRPDVDLWMNDGMSVKAMLASGTQMLRMSQSAEQRVATAHVEKNLRTASTQGVANIPGYAGSTSNVSSDLQQALKTIFMERFQD